MVNDSDWLASHASFINTTSRRLHETYGVGELEDYRQMLTLHLWQIGRKRKPGDKSSQYYAALNACREARKWIRGNTVDDPNPEEREDSASLPMQDLLSNVPDVLRARLLLWLDGTSYAQIAKQTGGKPRAVAREIKAAICDIRAGRYDTGRRDSDA